MSIFTRACSRSGRPSSVDSVSCPSIHPQAACCPTTSSDANSFSATAARTTCSFPIVAHGSTAVAFITSSTRCRGKTGLRAHGVRNGPRMHDFRHRFAVQVLTRWYESGEDPARRLPVLSTYLGRVRVAGTYWYLSNSPELMAQAMVRLERRWGEAP